MRLTTLIIDAVLFLILFSQCGRHPDTDGYGTEYPDAESYAVIDSCMAYMESDPALAHRMLDSVCDAGIMSPQRCRYLHAMVVFEGESKPDSALMMCNSLLDDGNMGDDRLLEAEICELATNITTGCGRYIELVQYANRGIALCRGREKLRSDEATMLGRLGVAYQMLGNLDEARQTYARALDLLREDQSFGGLIALISLQKKQARLYLQTGDYDRVISICQEILCQVDRFDCDPTFVEPRPTTMEVSGPATHDFADFYQTQMYVRIAEAYRLKVEQGATADAKTDRDSAAAYVNWWTLTAASRLPQNMASALPELYFTGRRAEFDAAKQAVGEYYSSDTLVVDYIEYLKLLAQDAASRHDMDACAGYLQRAVAVDDSIRQHDLLRTFAEQMSIHMVQEAQLAQRDAEYRLSRNRILMVFLITILLTSIIINALIWANRRRQRAIETVQQDLEETKEEVQELELQLEEVKAERPLKNSQALYQRIEQVVSEKKLFLNPNLDILMLSKEVNSSRSNVSICINSVTGKTFRNWLSEYRLSLFVRMLKETPDAPIEELMSRCGYQEQSTFRRQFKATYGMPPSDYRKLLTEQTGPEGVN